MPGKAKPCYLPCPCLAICFQHVISTWSPRSSKLQCCLPKQWSNLLIFLAGIDVWHKIKLSSYCFVSIALLTLQCRPHLIFIISRDSKEKQYIKVFGAGTLVSNVIFTLFWYQDIEQNGTQLWLILSEAKR